MPSFEGWRWGKGDREEVDTTPGYQEKTMFKKEGVSASIISGNFPLKIRKMSIISFY